MGNDAFRNYTERYYCLMPRFKNYDTYVYNEIEQQFELCEDPENLDGTWIIGSNGKPSKIIEDEKPQSDSGTSVHVEVLRRSGDFNRVYPSSEITNLWRLNDAIERGSNDARTLLLDYCYQNGLPSHRIIGNKGKIRHGFSIRTFHDQMNEINDWYKWINKTSEGFTDPLTIRGDEIVLLEESARIVLDLADENKHIRYECDNVIRAVRLWLMYRTSSKNANVGVCELCSAPFVPLRSSRRYCEECGNSTNRSREHRKRKKQQAE